MSRGTGALRDCLVSSPRTRWLDLNHPMAWLVLGLGLVIAPHTGRMPLWIPVWFAVIALGRLLEHLQGSQAISHWLRRLSSVRHVLTLGLVVAVYLSFGTLMGRDAGVPLLVVLLGLKLLEIRSRRDHFVLVFIGYFLVITNFLYSQSIPTALYMFAVVIVITAGLIALNDVNAKLTATHRLRLSASLVMQSLPIMLVAFLLFPRISGPLWGVPNEAYANLPGLNDEMAPGTISKLSQSNAVAFRVKFHSAVPDPSLRYWRGPVLWATDGQTWTPGISRNAALVPVYVYDRPVTYTYTGTSAAYANLPGLNDEMAPGTISKLSQSNAVAFRVKFHSAVPDPSLRYWRGPVLWATDGQTWTPGISRNAALVPVYVYDRPVTYTVTLEPHNQRWLFVLDMPSSSLLVGRLTRDFQMIALAPVRRRLRYTADSYPQYRISTTDIFEKSRALQLPVARHPRALALARTWREKSSGVEEVVQRALEFFHAEEFYYTLTPPLITGDSVDAFLFDTRRGFCEHYAGAFATLMRAAGIPTRIVTGYHGGEYNPIGDYFIVRQRDAHAWAEVWFSERGWVRIDPTTAIHPSRIELAAGPVTTPGIAAISLTLEHNATIRQLWRRLHNTWDATKNQWNQWVLGYGPKRQVQLLSELGIGQIDWRGMTLGLVASITTILFSVALWLFWRPKSSIDPIRAAYDQFCRRLARRGIARATFEGPIEFARRASVRYPARADEIDDITNQYIRLRYSARPGNLSVFKARVRHFHP